MPDQEEAHGYLDLAAGAVLNHRFVEVERAGAKDIELHLFRRIRRHRPGGRQKQSQGQRTKDSRTTQQHVVLPVSFSMSFFGLEVSYHKFVAAVQMN